jgi:hypothetical protein
MEGGKRAISTMENHIRELELEINSENRQIADAQKNLHTELNNIIKCLGTRCFAKMCLLISEAITRNVSYNN